jgi:hydrogenase maturation protease
MNHAAVHVLCFGNPWQGDERFGLHVLRQLREQRRLPTHVRTFDAGTAGLNALPLFEGCTKAVLVDAVRTGADVGRIHLLRLNDRFPNPDQQAMHGAGVEHLLAALPAAFVNGTIPKLVVIGAEIGKITPFATALSPQVAAATSQAVSLVMRECANLAG